MGHEAVIRETVPTNYALSYALLVNSYKQTDNHTYKPNKVIRVSSLIDYRFI